MALCIAAAASITRIAALSFTLSWTHSVQKTIWEEDWQVSAGRLHLIEARIESTGAGMEMPESAVFDGKVWRWKPTIAPLPELQLRRSDAVPEGYRLCADGRCRAIADAGEAADIIVLSSCP
ncbi:MAG: DUF1850 domain-containing protein [Beijerinckiaceae bacterium]|nr:DUF1850 domain-containing protein [Beijerinckiaceae bacterium]